MSAHQPHANFEFVCISFAGEVNNSLCTRPIDGNRLFHKNVQPTTDCVFKMRSTECCWSCKYCDVTWTQCVECLLKSIKPHKHTIVGHIDLFRKLFAQNPPHHLCPTLSDICKRSELERRFNNTKCVCSCTTPTATTPNQCNVD